MTEREKIIEILKQTSDLWKEEESHGYIVSVDLGKIADALIEAGIGDVKDCREYYKQAHDVAQRAFHIWDETFVKLWETETQKEEAEHRANVAQRAFDNTIKAFHETLSALFPDEEIDLDKWKRDNLANAEKELAEEEKK